MYFGDEISSRTRTLDAQVLTTLCISAACILLCLAVGCRKAESISKHIDVSLERMVPAETQVLAGIDIEELRKTPVYTKLLAEQK